MGEEGRRGLQGWWRCRGDRQRAGSQGDASVGDKKQRGQRSRRGGLEGEGGGRPRDKEHSGPTSSWRMSSCSSSSPPPLLQASTRSQLSFRLEVPSIQVAGFEAWSLRIECV